MIKKTFSNNLGTYITQYDYYFDKSNLWIATLSDLQFNGVQPKNLLKSKSDAVTGSIYIRYTCQFSADGKPIKIIYEADTGNYRSLNLEISCP